MKKLFVSVPMKNRTEEAINKSIEEMRKIAEIVFGEELEVIDSFLPMPDGNYNIPIYCLGRSIQKLAEADYFIGISYSENFTGCLVERDVARHYGIPSTFVDLHECVFLKDAMEINNRLYNSRLAKETCELDK